MNTHAPADALGLINTDAETAVLAAMRAETAAAVEAAQKLEPTDFHDPRHAIVFEAIRVLLMGIEPVDTSAIVAECRSLIQERKLKFVIDAAYVDSLETGDVRRAQMYANTVKRLAWLRGAGDFAFWLVQELQTRPDPDDLFAAAQERWQILAPKTENSRFVYGWDTQAQHNAELRRRIQDRAEGVVTGFNWPWRSWNERIRPLRPGFVGILAAPDGIGKCLGKGTKVVMYDATLRAVEDIRVGDRLMGPDSKPRTVLSLGRGRDQMYWIHQKGGISYRVNSEHILALYERKDIWRRGRKAGHRKVYTEITVKDALRKWTPSHMKRYVQGFKRPVDWPEQPVPIPPYMLGLWLGDGSANQIQFQITSADTEVVDAIHAYADGLTFTANGRDYQGVVRKQGMAGNAASTYSIGFGVKGARSQEYKQNSPVCQLRALGIHNDKHIPQIYKATSVQARLELLAGLIDSDGWYEPEAKVFGITMKNERLMRDIKFLADSLGYRTRLVETKARSQNGTEVTVWRMSIVGDCDRIPTRIIRKQAVAREINKDWRTWAIEIVPDTVDDYYGFQIDGDGLFLLEDMTVTHNTAYLEMVAEHWASCGYHTVCVHLEDALDYKLDRRMARRARVRIDHIEDGNLTAEEQQRIADAEAHMGFADCLHYYDAAGQSMAAILRELESRVAEGVCQAVIFDYLDKVQPTRAQAQLYGGNSWERQANDMEQLKTFAERQGVPVFTATQGNKSMQETGTQTRKAIQGSGQKSQKAQLVVILTRDIVGENGLRDKTGKLVAQAGEYSPLANLRIDKQNRGKTGDFRQFFDGQYFTARDIVTEA